MMRSMVIATCVVLFGTSAISEVRYTGDTDTQRADVTCVAGMSIARDITEFTDPALFRRITDIQNQFFLKYDRIPYQHIDVRKILVKTRMSENPDYLATLLNECADRL